MNKRALVWALALGAVAAAARGSEPITLAEAARRALARHPALRAADARMDQARHEFNQVRAQHVPRLEAGSTFTRGDGPVYAFSSLLDAETFGPDDMARLTDPGYVSHFRSYVRVGVPLFTGFELTGRSDAAEAGLSQAEVEARGARQHVRLVVMEAAVRHIQHRTLTDTLDARIRDADREVANAQRLRARGLVLGSDYFAAEAVLTGLRAWRLKADRTALSARETLAILLAEDPDRVRLIGRLGPGGPLLPSENELLTLARVHRADLRAADDDVRRAQAAAGIERATLYPRVSAMAQAETNTEDFSSNPGNRLIMLNAAWAIGDPSYGARRDKAHAAHSAGRLRRDALEEQARLDILQAVRRFEGARDTLPLLQETVTQARRSLDMVRPLHREGRQSILDVLKAEEALARAEAQALDALADMHLARGLAYAAGGVLDEGVLAALSSALEAAP